MIIFLEVLLLIFLLTITALTAASEISIIAASRIRLRKRAAEGSVAAKTVLKILEAPERFFGTILVSNNLVNTLIAVIVTGFFIRIVGQDNGLAILLSTIIVSVLIIVLEVAAKTVASRHSDTMSLALARPIKFFIKIFYPVVRTLEILIHWLTDLFRLGPKRKSPLVTEEEIRAVIKIGEIDDVLHRDKYKMLTRVFEFNESIVKNVMMPKTNILAINIEEDFDDILLDVIESGYSRFPVYQGSIDNIVGMVNMKDLLNMAYNRDLIILQDIIYPATFVSETKRITHLLKEFQKGHTHLAIVKDAEAKIVGIVTLEDLLEEIVGEIEDESDVKASEESQPT